MCACFRELFFFFSLANFHNADLLSFYLNNFVFFLIINSSDEQILSLRMINKSFLIIFFSFHAWKIRRKINLYFFYYFCFCLFFCLFSCFRCKFICSTNFYHWTIKTQNKNKPNESYHIIFFFFLL